MRLSRSVMLGFGLTLLLAASAVLLWILHKNLTRNDHNWLDRQITAKVRALLESELGLEVQTLEVRLVEHSLKLRAKKETTQLELDGEFELERHAEERLLTIRLNFQGRAETPGIILIPAFEGTADVTLPTELSRLGEIRGFGLGAQAKEARLTGVNTRLGQNKLELRWEGKSLEGSLASRVLEWSNPEDTTQELRIEHIDAHLSTPLTLKPLEVGSPATIELKFKSGELLLGDYYATLKGPDLPLKLTYAMSPQSVTLEVGKKSGLRLFAHTLPPSLSDWQLSVESSRLEQWVPQFTSFKGVSRGKASLQARFNLESKELKTATLKLRDLDLRLKEFATAANGISGDLELTPNRVVLKDLKADSIGVMKFRANLTPLGLEATRSGTDPNRWDFKSSGRVGLHIGDLPLAIGALEGAVIDGKLELFSNVNLPPTPLIPLTRAMCMDSVAIPATAAVALTVPLLAIGPDWAELQGGELIIAGFDGLLRVDRMAIYRALSSVPETQLNAVFTGFQLRALGEFLGFGEMDGILEGHLKDLTLQGPLPTQFDFLLRALPVGKKPNIVFSAKAMHNFVRLFAGDEIDQIPGIASWLAFGWPSELFGGYDINYLGIKVFSAEAALLVETLDPPEILKKEGRRYVLYGPRFKMPLNTGSDPSKPLVVDASAMSRFVRQVKTQIEGIAEAKQKEKGLESPNKSEALNDSCLPLEFQAQ